MHDGGGTAEKWGLQISFSSTITVEEVIQTPDGGYAALASNMRIGNNHSGIIIKISSTGSIEWQRSYNTAYRTVFYGLDNTHEGGFIVSGYERTSSNGFPYDESLFLKLDGDGDIIWEKTFNTNNQQLTSKKDQATSSKQQAPSTKHRAIRNKPQTNCLLYTSPSPRDS